MYHSGENEGHYAYVGTGGIWEVSVPPFQVCCESKTVLKNKALADTENGLEDTGRGKGKLG